MGIRAGPSAAARNTAFRLVWRTDGQKARQRGTDALIQEIVELRRQGFKYIALADDNFYPATLTDIALAERQNKHERIASLKAIRAERFEFMERLSQLPRDLIFLTQITMEAAEDDEFLAAMRKGRILGALVGVEAVTREGLRPYTRTSMYPAKILSAACKSSANTVSKYWVHLSSDCRPTGPTPLRPQRTSRRRRA